MRAWIAAALVAGLAALCLAWGYVAHRNAVFPAELLEGAIQWAKPLLRPGTEGPADAVPQELFTKDGGFWRARRPDEGGWSDELHRLQALGYVEGTHPAVARTGVTVFDPARAQEGLNLYSSAHAAEAYLMDMRGRVLHRWAIDRDAVWPELAGTDAHRGRRYFRRVHLFENGDLLAIFEYTGLVRLDASSRLLWAHQAWDHHDLDVDRDGRIYVLVRTPRRLPRWDVPVWDEAVAVLGPGGEPLGEISISAAIEGSRYAPLLDLVDPVEGDEPFDVFHTNTVQRLDGSLSHLSPHFAEGNLLVSMRNLNTIGIIDPSQQKMVWALSGAFRAQHEPSLLPGGTLLLFDNLAELDRSAVVELDPMSQQVVWEYSGSETRPLFSALFGASQRLANGNTLVTESEFGRAIEVTPQGEVVWEYQSPHTAGDHHELVAVIPELVRLPADFPLERFAGAPREPAAD